ncbi:MAG: GNAT family N-acetyltransferase [Rhodobacteraceae bacterium]|nr:GNAT family N-acetyltransferase [Paracoccaceae bacterium]
MPDFSTTPASPAEFMALRDSTGLGAFSARSSEIALANTLHGVWLRDGPTLVGMGRLIGDGGCFAQVTDICVAPDLRGRGWGQAIVTRLMRWADAHLPSGCYISLIADPGAERLYERAGFIYRTGMSRSVP